MANALVQKEDEFWRKMGYHAENAECACAMSKRDLFGFVDRIYLGQDGDMIMVQITRTDHMQDRIQKILWGSVGHGQHRIRMAEIVRRLMEINALRVYVVGWQLNERTWRYQRTERPIFFGEIVKALSE